jgi:hypothetical protein
LRAAAEIAVWTPGSAAGRPLSLLGSFSPPPPDADDAARATRLAAAAGGLLGLLGRDADPVRSPEHALLTAVLDDAWRRRTAPGLAELVPAILDPPFRRIGVMDVDTFLPAKDRRALALAVNQVLAAPGFTAWAAGAPLDPGALLRAPDGRPRVSIISLAHLGEPERMLVVSLLLGELLTWLRTQPGTSSLRALLYMDEIAGYAPPTANPPSKPPLLTLLKQARAYGLGVALATQNPADLDYKGLSNAGLWLIGRLQAARDRERLLDGLEAGGRTDRATLDRLLDAAGKRVFLLHSIHAGDPVLFETRWTLSYLRGPLTPAQIRDLEHGGRAAAPAAAPGAPAAGTRPALPRGVPQAFVPPRGGPAAVLEPRLLGCATIRVTDARAGLDLTFDLARAAQAPAGPVAPDWAGGEDPGVGPRDLATEPPAGAAFADPPAAASDPGAYAGWKRSFAEWAWGAGAVDLFRAPALKAVSRPGESEAAFRDRLALAARERRDAAIEALRRRYEPKQAALAEALRRAEAAVERERSQAGAQSVQAAVSLGATLLGAFLGRRAVSLGTLGRATTAARGAARVLKERGDVARAGESAEAVRARIAALDEAYARDVAALEAEAAPAAVAVEPLTVRPRKSDVTVTAFALAWVPR